MVLQQCSYLLDGRRILLPEDLISDDPGEHMVRGCSRPKREGVVTANVRSTRNAISDTVASYAISDAQGTRKNALDNRQ
jgi:hypothetical protein